MAAAAIGNGSQGGAVSAVSTKAVIVTPPQSISALDLLKSKTASRSRRPRLCLLRSPRSPDAQNSGVFELDLGITEIAGEAGSGKTQLALGLCVACASSVYEPRTSASDTTPEWSKEAPDGVSDRRVARIAPVCEEVHNPYAVITHNESSEKEIIQPRLSRNGKPQFFYRALYVSMGEGGTQAQIAHRLNQMAEQRQKENRQGGPTLHSVNNVLARVVTRFIRNQDEFLDLIDNELPSLLAQSFPPIGFVVFDSIAGIFRVSDSHQPHKSFFGQRTGTLFHVAARLKLLSDNHDVPMVVINQVTSKFSKTGTGSSSTDNVVPALGVTWSNCINTSYLISRSETSSGLHNDVIESEANSENTSTTRRTVTPDSGSGQNSSARPLQTSDQTRFIRKATLRFSSHSPVCSVAFRIDSGGAATQESPQLT